MRIVIDIFDHFDAHQYCCEVADGLL